MGKGSHWSSVANHWSKGPHRERVLTRLSEVKKGFTLTPEHVAKIKAGLRGKTPKNLEVLHETRRGSGMVLLCAGCGASFQPKPPGYNKTKYCGVECYRTYFGPSQRGKPRPNHAGEKHHNWKGGITPHNAAIRTSVEYRQWREAVFKRDDFTCQMCGVRGAWLHAHHIKAFSTHPTLRFDVGNGMTLCVSCHRGEDTRPDKRTESSFPK